MRLTSDVRVSFTVHDGFVQINVRLLCFFVGFNGDTRVSNINDNSVVDGIADLHKLCNFTDNSFVNYLRVFYEVIRLS